MEKKCNCEGPYTCKSHDGEFRYCSNEKCVCHLPHHDNWRERFDKNWPHFGNVMNDYQRSNEEKIAAKIHDNKLDMIKDFIASVEAAAERRGAESRDKEIETFTGDADAAYVLIYEWKGEIADRTLFTNRNDKGV